ncbi:MAG: glycosyltransferase [Opitutae bacterium]|nr:glycosyltransferase [Opitutae bacterium]
MTTFSLLAQLPACDRSLRGWPWTEETSPAEYASPPLGGWPRVTIVCPSFNQGAYLEETMRSVLLQNYPDLEFIVMDGGSTDATVDHLKRYSPWITYWESQPDHGQSHALNKGFARATGDILGWINSDDYYQPGALAAVGRAFRETPRALLYGDWCEREESAPGLITHHERPAFAFQVAAGGRTLPSHATFWPRSAHQPVDERLRFTMDAELFKRLAASGLRPRHLARPLGVFRRHAEAKTSTIIEVARAETAAWSRTQPWHTHWRWLASRALDRMRSLFAR